DAAAELLLVDEQQAVGDLHLVGVRARRGGPLLDEARRRRVRDVEDRRPHAADPEVADVDRVALAQHLHPVAEPAEIVVGEQAHRHTVTMRRLLACVLLAAPIPTPIGFGPRYQLAPGPPSAGRFTCSPVETTKAQAAA